MLGIRIMRFRIGFASLAHVASRGKYNRFTKHSSYCWSTPSYLSPRNAGCPLFAKYTSGRTFHLEAEFERPGVISWQPELANSVQLIGHLGSDVDIRYLQTGKVVAASSLAVNKPTSKSIDGECMWFQLEFWEELAEIAACHLKKGAKIFVSGHMTLDTYSNSDNVQKLFCKIVARDLKFVGNKPSSSSADPTDRKPAIEELWQTFFKDPSKWWDDRADKLSPNSPDFKHKLTGDALWINGGYIPKWVNIQLAKLDSRVETEDGVEDAMGSGPTERKKGIERLWQAYFKNPSEWWDNREHKFNPKAPDFKHKLNGDSLWISDRNIPEWVNLQLTLLDSREEREGAGDAMGSGSTTRKSESSWKTFFERPSEWWDNRQNKISPRGPDFKHKSTGEALWINSRYNPEWVNSQLATLDNRSMAGKEETSDATDSGIFQGALFKYKRIEEAL